MVVKKNVSVLQHLLDGIKSSRDEPGKNSEFLSLMMKQTATVTLLVKETISILNLKKRKMKDDPLEGDTDPSRTNELLKGYQVFQEISVRRIYGNTNGKCTD